MHTKNERPKPEQVENGSPELRPESVGGIGFTDRRTRASSHTINAHHDPSDLSLGIATSAASFPPNSAIAMKPDHLVG